MSLVLATYALLGALCGLVFGRARGMRSEFVFREVLHGALGALVALLALALARKAGGALHGWRVVFALLGAGAALTLHAFAAALGHAPDEAAPDVAYRRRAPLPGT